MRAIITGVTGFVGQHLAAHLLASGDTVLGIARSADWLPGTMPAVSQAVPLVAQDMAQPWSEETISAMVRFQPTAVYHLAGLSIPADCGATEPTELANRINHLATAELLDLALDRLDLPKVMLMSTARVYGRVSSEEAVVSESRPLNPDTGYGKTKLAAEQAAHRMAEAGLPVMIVRAFQQAGPGQPDRTMLGEWCRRLAETPPGTPLSIRTADAWLDLCDVRDSVQAYRLIMKRVEVFGEFNVGSGKPICSGDVAKELVNIEGSERSVVETQPRTVQEPIADTSRIQALGWAPTTPLERTLTDTLAWWQSRLASETGAT
jgi:GDP-4-dehydro-6-deoxy-D-mannose reductase